MSKTLFIVPDLRFSGLTTDVFHRARELAARGQPVQVFSLQGGGPAKPVFSRLGVEVREGSPSAWDLNRFFQLRQQVKSFQPDLIHAGTASALRTLVLAVGFPACTVVLSHPLTITDRGEKIGFLDRWLINCCQQVLVKSRAEEEKCQKLGIDSHKIERIPFASDSISQGDNPFSQSKTLATLDPTILCVGPIHRHKGFYEAIWAYDVLRHLLGNLKLWIVGDGPDLVRLRRFVDQLRLENQVCFWGTVPDVSPFYHAAQVVWVPSLAEAGHQVLLEAQAAGKPVVASGWPGLAEYVLDNQSGFLVPPARKELFAKKTRLLIEAKDLREEMGQNGRGFIARLCQIEPGRENRGQSYQTLVA